MDKRRTTLRGTFQRGTSQRQSTRTITPQDFNYSVKCVVIGDSGVGKTCLLQRIENNKMPMKTTPTVDGIFHKRLASVDDRVLQLAMWDTAGAEVFKSVTRIFYRKASCALLVYDITSRATFLSIPGWIEDVRENSGNSKIVMVLVANKSDLESERQVSADEGANMARLNGMEFIETSAKNLHNTDRVFDLLAEQIYHNIKIGNITPNSEVNGIKIGERKMASPGTETGGDKSERSKCSC